VNIRGISFDLFDTLVDLSLESLPEFALGERSLRGTQALLFAALPPSAKARWGFASFVHRDEALRSARSAGGRELPTLERFAALCADLGIADAALPARLTSLHMEEIYRRTAYCAHHRSVLERLRGEFRLAVCSNFSDVATAERVLRQARLDGLLDAVVISAECGMRKPRTEIFCAVSERLQLDAGAILHVGDRLDEDVSGAHAAGMRTAWITRRVANWEEALHRHRGARPDWVFRDLAELPERLQPRASEETD
jgi:HAD superfamily hydrolase (TIGR01549 family)